MIRIFSSFVNSTGHGTDILDAFEEWESVTGEVSVNTEKVYTESGNCWNSYLVTLNYVKIKYS